MLHLISISSALNSLLLLCKSKAERKFLSAFFLSAVSVLVAVLILVIILFAVLITILVVAAILIIVLVAVLILITVTVLVVVLVGIHDKSSDKLFAEIRKYSLPDILGFILCFKEYTHQKSSCDCRCDTTSGCF